ncbi:MAG: hydrolase, family [Eubacterium sp.]|jgi:ADP-ribose pyrophosphatase YjhB (NUDIX family)|nr:hydrolase, family [Eubacterium sp.]
MSIQRHFTVSVYIVHKNKVLLHRHKKYGIILPLGGHIEKDELPEEACLREVLEESGLNITLISDKNSCIDGIDGVNSSELIRPMHMRLCKVDTDHYHIDLNYYATSETFDLNPQKGETSALYWFAKNELTEIQNAPKDVILMTNEALGFLGGES